MQSTEKDYIARNGTHIRVRRDKGYIVASDGTIPNTVVASESHEQALKEYFTECEPASVSDLDVHVALNNFYDSDRTWEMWENYQVEGMRRVLEQSRFPSSHEEAETFKRVAEQRKRIEERLDRAYGSPAPRTFKSKRAHEAWRALVDFLYVTQRRAPEPGIALSLDESNVLAWAILKAFRVKARR